MAPKLDTLPEELLQRITDQVDSAGNANLRLVCRRLSSSATASLFSKIKLYPTDTSIEQFNFLRDSDLVQHVHTCLLNTCEDDFNTQENGEETELPDDFLEAFGSVFTDLPNLRAVSLKFDENGAHEEDPNVSEWVPEWPESVDFRHRVLGMLFEGLAGSETVKDLSIVNLQNIVKEEVTSSKNFKTVMARLESLDLKIVIESDSAAPEFTWAKSALHDFPGELPSLWLTPTSASLKHLGLAMTTYLGYFPRLDLRGVHFPNLKTLSLEKYSFSHDWQLDWILEHGKTLRELYLRDCPIIYHILPHSEDLDDEGYYIDTADVPIHVVYNFDAQIRYPRRWSYYFDQFREKLHLRHFRFAGGALPNYHERFEHGDLTEVPIELEGKRYMAFHGGGAPDVWAEDNDEIPELDRSPAVECEEGDREALERLLRSIGQAVVLDFEYKYKWSEVEVKNLVRLDDLAAVNRKEYLRNRVHGEPMGG